MSPQYSCFHPGLGGLCVVPGCPGTLIEFEGPFDRQCVIDLRAGRHSHATVALHGTRRVMPEMQLADQGKGTELLGVQNVAMSKRDVMS